MRLRVQTGWPFLPWQQPRELIARDPNRFGRLYSRDRLLGWPMFLGFEGRRDASLAGAATS